MLTDAQVRNARSLRHPYTLTDGRGLHLALGTYPDVPLGNYRPAPGELRFDMYDAEYTHDATRCTFEVMLDLIEKPDAAMRRIADIIHDLDLKDHKYQRPETAGVKMMLDGLTANHERDEDRVERASSLFEDLHKSFSKALA